MMFWYDHDMNGWGWLGMSLGMIVFWGLIVTAFVLLLRTLGRPAPGGSHDSALRTPPAPPSAEQLLAERFARGEIDEEEYQRRLRVLHTAGAGPAKH
ncbi:SHOCT domain-containing protein [Streptomyces actuosus]|uniref:SHOCT domain-containing protein n=1 Tax=Streptomyces actuosus TaxID=1885 RepID=A0ABS2VJ18_STRAS|nr:SHOCT domain-containing protein [Streptomyces actuosus]MBN0043067.1 SHOCT domain-containing protein [Streptomyces actuosus]